MSKDLCKEIIDQYFYVAIFIYIFMILLKPRMVYTGIYRWIPREKNGMDIGTLFTCMHQINIIKYVMKYIFIIYNVDVVDANFILYKLDQT
jgi:hypothetical protein